MAQILPVHPVNPEPRLIRQAAEVLRAGGVIVYPTDSTYALGCCIGDKSALERIRRIRQLDSKHNFTLMCQDLSSIAVYAKVPNSAFRLLKTYTPGPYTFILPATAEVPRRLMHPKKRTIGLRMPDHVIAQALLGEIGQPLMSTTLILPAEEEPMTEPYLMQECLGNLVDLIVDGGPCGFEQTTVVDLVANPFDLVRVGKGDPEPFR